MDGRGAPVWYQVTDPGAIEFRRRADGLFVGVSALGPRYGVLPNAGYEVFTLTGDVVDTVISDDEGGIEHPTDHHDIIDLPGGGAAVISYPLLGNQNLTTVPSGDFGANETIADNVIQELDPSGNAVWSWRAS